MNFQQLVEYLNAPPEKLANALKSCGLEKAKQFSDGDVEAVEAFLKTGKTLEASKEQDKEAKNKVSGSEVVEVVIDDHLRQGALQTANLQKAQQRQLVNTGNRMISEGYEKGLDLGRKLVPAIRSAQVTGFITGITEAISTNNDFRIKDEMFPDISLDFETPDLTPEAKKFLIAQTEAEALLLGGTASGF